MPYIDQTQRDELDPLIDALVHRLKPRTDPSKGATLSTDDHAFAAGRLNYAVTRLVLGLMGETKYWKIALYCGVLSNVAAEFYRKLAAPYEDKKIAENGDVYP